MDRTSISMDLRSISCKGIKCFNLFQKSSTYAVITVIDPSNPSRQQKKKKTAVDSDGGENPEWTEAFRFDLDGRDPALALEIDLMVQGNLLLLLGERLVGKVHVPIADLLKEGSDGSVHHVSYRVMGTDGKPNGEIRFSYNINYPAAVTVPAGGYCPPPYQLNPAIPSPAGGYCPPPYQLNPAIPSPAGGYCPRPYQLNPVVPSPAGSYYPLQDPVVPSPAADFYPPQGQQYPVVSSPASGFYPPPRQQYPVVSSPVSDFYPPPRQQEPVIAFPTSGCYPPPRQQYPSSVGENYPSQYQQEPVVCYPPPAAVVGSYPPPSTPPCCYPSPPAQQQEGYGYRSEIWDRQL